MKILGINASPKGKESQTLRLVNAVLEGARDAGAETELVDLCQLEIEYCTACGVCYETGECTLIDDFPDLFELMMGADGIVLGSPNYIDSVTAPLKAAFDRMADAIHCQMFSGKYGCSVCTAGGSNEMEVVGYMNRVLTSLGATTIGGVGVAFQGNPDRILPAIEKARALGKELAGAIRTRKVYPEQAAIHKARREYFCRLVEANRDRWRHEYDWWVAAGEIRKD
ncbi:MAG: flavodoxin family protein [Methanomicrobiales archaeon]|nr:flavodoxin family protein [Methanomicrobiales archaeon]